MIDNIETYYIQELGKISRPFSQQLKARQWTDPIREVYRQHIAKLYALAYPVVGVDISYWQQSVDWNKMASKVYFVFIRAGRGNADRDTLYSSFLRGAHDKGRAVGIYWYMMPRTVTNFKTHVQSFAPIYKDSGSQLPPVFDVEDNGGMGKTALTGWLQKAVALFEDTTGVAPMIYTSAGFWNSNTYRNDWAKRLPLWVAHWTTADEPIIPNDWGAINQPKPWTFWQYTSKGKGFDYGVASLNIDLDRYYYSLTQFNQQYKMNLQPLEPLPPTPPPVPTDKIHPLYQVEITADMLNARAGDGATYTDIGNLLKGTQLPVTEESGDWLKSEFYLHKNYVKKI